MSLVIELVVDDRAVDGMETWWDEIPRAIAITGVEAPLLSSIDATSDAEFRDAALQQLIDECEPLRAVTERDAGQTAARLQILAREAQQTDGAFLRFLGD